MSGKPDAPTSPTHPNPKQPTNPHLQIQPLTLLQKKSCAAEYERTMISARTKAALDSAKRRGTKLGNPRFNESLGRARECRRVQSHQRFEQLVVVVCELQRSGCHRLKDLANGLNARGLKTARGSQFTPTQVHRILNFAQ
jgi:DNA invertase Pin-like site-specific DNA recombinase